jgi:hypothetical protein
MVGGIRASGKWSVLVLDNVTTQIMTNVCGVADLLDYGVSCKLKFTKDKIMIRIQANTDGF